MNNSSTVLLIIFTLIIAMMLMLMPMPYWAQAYRPEWLMLVLIYWCIALPEKVGVGIAWALGLCVDVIQGALLGQHALGFAITAYIAIRFHQRVRNYPLHQQSLFVGMILLPYMSLSLWTLGILGEDPKSWLYWAPVVTSVLIWPWIYLVMRAIRKSSPMY